MDNWFLVYCKPRQELRAQQNLANLGFNSYLPQLTKTRKRGGIEVEIKELLFPRYLFIQAQADANLAVVKNTRGVADFVRFGGVIAKIPTDLIEQVTRQQISFQKEHQQQEYLAGEVVEICDGPFMGMQAIFQTADGEKRSMILIQLLNTSAVMSLPKEQLCRIA